MRNINTWLLFVFLLHLATTGGKESGGEEILEDEVVMEEKVEEDSLVPAAVGVGDVHFS